MTWYHCGSLLSIVILNIERTELYCTNKILKFKFRNREEFSWCKLQHFQVSRLSGQTHDNIEHKRLSYQVHCHKRMSLRLWINMFVTKNIRCSCLLLMLMIFHSSSLSHCSASQSAVVTRNQTIVLSVVVYLRKPDKVRLNDLVIFSMLSGCLFWLFFMIR